MKKTIDKKIGGGSLRFDIKINVNNEGIFSTTIPAEIAAKFESCGIKLDKNRLKNPGYYTAKTLAELVKQIEDHCTEVLSDVLVSEIIVLQYTIETTCSYQFDIDGNFVPNGAREWTKTDANEWKRGTKDTNATNRSPYGFRLYVRPFYKRQYKNALGKERIDYEWIHWGTIKGEADYNLKFLAGLVSICPPRDMKHLEIEYTEPVGAFFVEMLKSIFSINEKIKHFTQPDQILELIKNNSTNLLGNG